MAVSTAALLQVRGESSALITATAKPQKGTEEAAFLLILTQLISSDIPQRNLYSFSPSQLKNGEVAALESPWGWCLFIWHSRLGSEEGRHKCVVWIWFGTTAAFCTGKDIPQDTQKVTFNEKVQEKYSQQKIFNFFFWLISKGRYVLLRAMRSIYKQYSCWGQVPDTALALSFFQHYSLMHTRELRRNWKGCFACALENAWKKQIFFNWNKKQTATYHHISRTLRWYSTGPQGEIRSLFLGWWAGISEAGQIHKAGQHTPKVCWLMGFTALSYSPHHIHKAHRDGEREEKERRRKPVPTAVE